MSCRAKLMTAEEAQAYLKMLKERQLNYQESIKNAD